MKIINEKNKSALFERMKYIGDYKYDFQKHCKEYPYFGYIDINIFNLPPFTMFSNNDCYVSQKYFWLGDNAYERHSLAIWSALAKKSPLTLDIGAYTGVYAIAAAIANPRSKIYAFEALDRNYFRLIVNKKVNALGNLEVINSAVSDIDGDIILNIYSGDSVLVTASSLIDKPSGRSVFLKKTISSISIDNYSINFKNQVGLIKIDTEGAEHLVFAGMKKMLLKSTPDILVEILKDSKILLIEKLIKDIPYNFYQINDFTQEIIKIDNLNSAKDMGNLNTLISLKDINELKNLLL